MGDELLTVHDLSAWYPNAVGEPFHVLNRLNLIVRAGEAVGLCGPSGGGKTTLAQIILRTAAACWKGGLRFRQEDIAAMQPARLRTLRGGDIALVPQEPSAALNPVRRIDAQVAEVLRAHSTVSKLSAMREARSALEPLLGPDTERVAASYPHQLSSGQRQRVVIAQSLCARPALLIADEPSSTLDSIAQHELLTLLNTLRRQTGMALLMMSHNPSALAFCTDRILTLQGGALVS